MSDVKAWTGLLKLGTAMIVFGLSLGATIGGCRGAATITQQSLEAWFEEGMIPRELAVGFAAGVVTMIAYLMVSKIVESYRAARPAMKAIYADLRARERQRHDARSRGQDGEPG
jgi:hypothetical protein